MNLLKKIVVNLFMKYLSRKELSEEIIEEVVDYIEDEYPDSLEDYTNRICEECPDRSEY